MSIFIAPLTYFMRGFAVCFAFLQNIGKSSRWKLVQFIAFFLCLPIFKAHNFLFKIIYALGSRRLRLLSEKQRLLGVDNMALQGQLNLIDSGCGLDTVQGLNNVLRRLEAAKASSNFSYSNHL